MSINGYIKRADYNDIKNIVEFIRRNIEENRFYFDFRDEGENEYKIYEENYVKKLLDKGDIILLYIENGQIVGLSHWTSINGIWYNLYTVVDKNHSNKGIATKLYDYFLKQDIPVAALIYDDKVNNRKRRVIELSPDTIKTGEEGMGSKLKEYPKIPGEIFVKKVVEIINGKYKEYSGFIFEISEYKGIIAQLRNNKYIAKLLSNKYISKLLNNKYIAKLRNLFGIDLRPTIKLYGMNPSKDRNIFDYHEKKLLEKIGKAVY